MTSALIAALSGAIAGGLFTVFISKQKIKADLRASTRLEWISEVRKLTADIINEHQKAEILVTNFLIDRKTSFDNGWHKIDVYDQKLQEIENTLSNKITLYKLYFSIIKRNPANVYQDNDRNIKMHKHADQILQEVNQYKNNLYLYNFKKIVDKDGVSNIENFRNATSDYLKKEWDRAKDNK